jgi:ATP-dependent RNA circularization protein (DNA/RNA ligase family)
MIFDDNFPILFGYPLVNHHFLMDKSTINGNFQQQTVSLPEGIWGQSGAKT